MNTTGLFFHSLKKTVKQSSHSNCWAGTTETSRVPGHRRYHGLTGPDQPHWDHTPGHGSRGPIPPQSSAWATAHGPWTYTVGSLSHGRTSCLHSCCWPHLLDELQTYAVTFFPVLSLALSPLVPNYTPWVDLGPCSSLSVSAGTIHGPRYLHPPLPTLVRCCGTEP